MSLESGESAKHSSTSLDSMEIKFEEILGMRAASASEREEAKKTTTLGLSPGRKKLSDASHISHQKSTRNTSMCAYLDTPLVSLLVCHFLLHSFHILQRISSQLSDFADITCASGKEISENVAKLMLKTSECCLRCFPYVLFFRFIVFLGWSVLCLRRKEESEKSRLLPANTLLA